MRKRKLRLAFAILLLAVLSGLTWLVVAPRDPPEPVYQGKRLSEWLYATRWPAELTSTNDYARAKLAVRQIGTNGIPTLLQMLRARDSNLKLKLIGLARKQHLIQFNFVTAEERNSEAARAFHFMGEDASNAVPALIQVFEEGISGPSQMSAIGSLREIGPAAIAAIPALLRNAGNANANAQVRGEAIVALGAIHAKSEVVVPVLIMCLKDTNVVVRYCGAWALERFGSNARAAVPALVDLLKDPRTEVQGNAEEALKAIDPEAAAKAGIK